jgi:hypothetical protein
MLIYPRKMVMFHRFLMFFVCQRPKGAAQPCQESPAELDVDGDSNTSGVGEAKLCLPSARWKLGAKRPMDSQSMLQ